MSIDHFYPVTEVWYFHFILKPEVWDSGGIIVMSNKKRYSITLDQLDNIPWLDKSERIGWRNYDKRPTVFYYRTQVKIYSSFPDSMEINYNYFRNFYLAERHFLPISYRDLYELLPLVT